MPAFTIILVAVVAGLLLGTTLVIGAPYLALPIVAVGIAVIGWLDFRRRIRRARGTERIREQGGADRSVEFTDRDRETLVGSAERERSDGGG